jgi:hypothetical protein
MSQPPPMPDWVVSTPAWTPPVSGAFPGSTWAPPTYAATPPRPPQAATRSRAGVMALVICGLVGLAAGAVAGASLVTAVFVGSAVDIGRGLSEGMVSSMEEAYPMDGEYAWGGGTSLPPADIGEPLSPVPGPDPVLTAYMQGCFEGDYQACDDLYFESPPMSAYEEYAATCGGRVKFGAVMYCTDLD